MKTAGDEHCYFIGNTYLKLMQSNTTSYHESQLHVQFWFC